MSCAKKRFAWFPAILAFVALGILVPNAALADITFYGDVSPSDSVAWDAATNGFVGYTLGAGTVTVTPYSTLRCNNAVLGYGGTATGTVNVDGVGAQWISEYYSDDKGGGDDMSGIICVGGTSAGATGTINVTNGGYVSSYQCIIGSATNSTGTISVESGSTWSGSWMEVGGNGMGVLAVRSAGTVSVVSLKNGMYNSGTTIVDGLGSTLNTTGKFQMGDWGNGYLTISNGGVVNSAAGCSLGADQGTGMATVDATGGPSKLNITSGDLLLGGEYSTGSSGGFLYIKNGGEVYAPNGETRLGWSPQTIGRVFFVGANGGTLTTKSLAASSDSVTGVGVVNTRGLVSNVNLTFDSVASLSQNLTFNGTVAVNLDMHDSTDVGGLGVGYTYGTSGLLTITNGVTVTSLYGELAHHNGSSGTALVTGSNSCWAVIGELIVGNRGNGTLNVQNGASVTSPYVKIGYGGSATSTVTVSGPDAILDCSNELAIGRLGILNVTGGGAISAMSITKTYGTTTATANFDGGILRARGNASQLMTGLANAYVKQGGLTIDTQGYNVAMDQPLLTDGVGSGGVTKIGTGTLTLTNTNSTASVNTYTGNTTVADGTLLTFVPGALPGYDSPGKVVVQSGCTVGARVNGANCWTSTEVGMLVTNANWAADGTSSLALDVLAEYDKDVLLPAFFAGTLTDPAGKSIGLKKLNGGYLLLAAPASYTGPTDIAEGVLGFTGVNYLPSGTAVNLANAYGVKLQLNDYNQTIASLSGGGFVGGEKGGGGGGGGEYYGNVDLGAGVLTVAGSASTVYAGAISGSGGLTKQGTGTLTLTGANSYTGLTTVGGGILAHGADNVLPDGGVTVTGGTLDLGPYSDSVGAVMLQGGVIASGSGTLTSTSGFNVQNGSASAILAGSVGLTKTTSGTVTLTRANTYTGLTTVDGGVLELGSAAQTVVLTGAGADIKHGKMVFDYTGAAPNIAALLADSYGTGGSMVPWSTGQFRCTIADGNYGLGWIDDTDNNQVTVMYTLYGDSNLDGSVNGSDLNAVLSSYNLSGQVWAAGDFNYDGSVNGSDLNTVLSNYNRSLPASTAAVPEPSTLLLMVLGLVGLLAWRRRFMI